MKWVGGERSLRKILRLGRKWVWKERMSSLTEATV